LVSQQSNQRKPFIDLIESQGTIDNRYTDLKAIDPNGGGGHFSILIKARDLQSSKQRKMVALKFFDPGGYKDTYRLNCFSRESDILLQLRGQRNILPIVQGKSDLQVKLKSEQGIEFPLQLIYYVAPLAETNIKTYIYSNPTYLRSIFYFREMCKAVQRIHKNKICHRDLKPDNFLIYTKRYVCLSDFGTARGFTDNIQPIVDHYPGPVGDLRYVAPELLCGLHSSSHHVFCADIYSLGAILFEFFTKNILSTDIHDHDTTMKLITNFHSIPEKNRLSVFDGVIGGIAEKKKLQSVKLYDSLMPLNLAFHIDRLYQGMACLDYRKRITDFNEIFMKINICEKIIQHNIVLEQRKIMKLKKKSLTQENINA